MRGSNETKETPSPSILRCQAATFSTPQAATTGWSKAAQGACTISVVASSNGFNVSQRFAIVVFPAGSGSGAVTVNGELVTTPSISLFMQECFFASNFLNNSSCSVPLASPTTAFYQLNVSFWGASSTPGTFALSDTCGGRFGTSAHGVNGVIGFWLPPVDGGICMVTARAVNGDGLAATLTVAILVRPGAPATAQPPQVFGGLENICLFSPSATPSACSPVQGGTQQGVSGNVSWGDGNPGSVTITDSCAGAQPAPADSSSFFAGWTVPNQPGQSCLTTIRATSLQGSSTEIAGQYLISAPMMAAPKADAPRQGN